MDLLALLAIFIVSFIIYAVTSHGFINFFAITFCLILAICIWALICLLWFSSMIHKLRKQPDQVSADSLVKMMKGLSGFSKLLISSNLLRIGMTFDLLRDTFNRIVYESPDISLATKHEVRAQFDAIRVFGLRNLPAQKGKSPAPEAAPQLNKQPRRYCTNCGKPLHEGTFCPHCGAKQ